MSTCRCHSHGPSEQDGVGLIVAGYVCAGLSLVVLPPVLGLAGFIIGIVNTTKGRVAIGVSQMIVSVVCGVLGFVIGMNSYNS